MPSSRRKAITKLGTALIGAVVAGVGGYAAGYFTPRNMPQTTQIVVRERTVTLERTMTHVVTTQPKLEVLPIRFTTTEGGITTAPNALMAKNLAETVGPQVGLRFETLNVVRGTGEAIRELTDGRADVVGPSTVLGLLGAIERQPNIKIFFFNDYGSYASVVVGPKVPYQSLEDMKRAIERGEKIRVGFTRPGSLSHSYSIVLAKLLGVEYGKHIEGVSLGEDAAIIAALVRGDIDAYTTANVVLGWSLEEEGKGRVIYYFKEHLGSTWHELAYATTTEIISRKSELIKRFVNYIRETTKIAMIDKTRVIENMTAAPPKGIGVKQSAAERYYDFYVPNAVGAPFKTALEFMRKIAIESGVAKNPPPVEQLYTTDFL